LCVDRAFLNEVCTDIILMKDKKLTYYKGVVTSSVFGARLLR